MKENAAINGVLDRMSIHGYADRNFYKAIDPLRLPTSVLLVDIEGGEFSLLDREPLSIFRKSVIIIELHGDLQSERVIALREAADEIFEVSELMTTARDPSTIVELHRFSDTDRWLICSEGRPSLMRWLRLDPRAE
jgi:hypothetical protein